MLPKSSKNRLIIKKIYTYTLVQIFVGTLQRRVSQRPYHVWKERWKLADVRASRTSYDSGYISSTASKRLSFSWTFIFENRNQIFASSLLGTFAPHDLPQPFQNPQ